jgi:hypothetical protein
LETARIYSQKLFSTKLQAKLIQSFIADHTIVFMFRCLFTLFTFPDDRPSPKNPPVTRSSTVPPVMHQF